VNLHQQKGSLKYPPPLRNASETFSGILRKDFVEFDTRTPRLRVSLGRRVVPSSPAPNGHCGGLYKKSQDSRAAPNSGHAETGGRINC
jgi:hypothetical protein